MPAQRIAVAYTYDADWHCVDCAHRRFATDDAPRTIPEDATDSEGNFPMPVFWDDEWWDRYAEECQTLYCGTCGFECAHHCGTHVADDDEPDGPTYDDDETAMCDCLDCEAAAEYTGGDC